MTSTSVSPALTLINLRVAYGWGDSRVLAVDGINLQIFPGRTLGLIGESGSGKSTVARAIVGLVRADTGNVELAGRDITNVSGGALRAVRRKVQMVFQDPYSSLDPRMSVADQIREATAIAMQEGGDVALNQTNALLREVELPESIAEKYPHQLSGGQRQRVALARALAVQPEVIVLDEVTSALDVSVQAAILNLLRRIQLARHLSYLMISHDLSVISYMSDVIAVMYLGRIIEEGSARDLLRQPRHPYTRSLLYAVPALGRPLVAIAAGEVADPRHPPAGCHFHPRCPIGPLAHPDRQICIQQVPALSAAHTGHSAACHFPLQPSDVTESRAEPL